MKIVQSLFKMTILENPWQGVFVPHLSDVNRFNVLIGSNEVYLVVLSLKNE